MKRRAKPVDSLSYHEVLDRVHLVSKTFGDFVAEHPACEQTPELAEFAEKIGDLLGDMYQATGKCWSAALDREERQP
jgi:hypothetical protein